MTERCGVYFFDVGQGDCTLIWPPAGDPVLVDCADAETARHFVRDGGIKALDAVVVSHLDQDHIGGMLRFLTDFMASGGKVGRLYIDKDRPRLSQVGLALLKQALDWKQRGFLEIAAPVREDRPRTVCRGEGWSIDIVLPHYAQVLEGRVDDRHAPNLVSAAVRVQCHGRTVLVGGDAPLGSWEGLDAHWLKADVFRSPHHGGDIGEGASTWTVSDLYRRVVPQLTVFSVGTRNPYEHPLPEHVHASLAGGPSRRLCTQLTARCHPDPQALRRAALKDVGRVTYRYSRHRRDGGPLEIPCAGTVLVVIDAAGAIETEPPRDGWHDAFVDRVKHPLCRASFA
jgi:beta-lactamase superfamily II metal-dependent hydrolase